MFLNICNTYSALAIISLIKNILRILMIIVPIILIVTSVVDMVKLTTSPEDSNVKKVQTSIVIRLIGTFIIFLMPVLVSILTSKEFLNVGRFEESSCWINSNPSYLSALKEVEEAERKMEKDKRKKIKELSEGKRILIAETRAKAEATNAQEAEKLRKQEEERKKKEAERFRLTTISGGSVSTGVLIPSNTLGAKVFNIALNEYNDPDGNRPRPNRYTCYLWSNYCPPGGYNDDYHWCAAFIGYVLNKAGVYPKYVQTQSGFVDDYVDYFKSKGQYELSTGHGGTYMPTSGDIIFFADDNTQSGVSHIGIVEGVSSGRIYFIDGNADDRIKHRHYDLDDKYVIGYGAWQK